MSPSLQQTLLRLPLWKALIGAFPFLVLSCDAVHSPSEKTLWRYRKGEDLQLKVSAKPLSEFSWEQVTLPHRVSEPNSPLWYYRTLSPVDRPTYLHVNADDGAQVFVNQHQIEAIRGYYYELPVTEKTITLQVRVLNNAMEGGLINVTLLDKDSIDEIWSTEDRQLQRLKYEMLPGDHRSHIYLPTGGATLDESKELVFTAWGDSQGGWETFRLLTEHMASVPDQVFSLGLGDLVSDGVNRLNWYSFFYCLRPFVDNQIPVFPLVGNHDYDGYYDHLNPLLYHELINSNGCTYSSWTSGPAIFLALDPNHNFPLQIDSTQMQYALRVLQSTEWETATWRFVLIHQPPYAQGWPGYQGDLFIRKFIEDHAESSQIDFVLSGHCHDFEYLKKSFGDQTTHFFVLGGGGGGLEPDENDTAFTMDTVINKHHYALFDLNPKQAEVEIRGLDNQVIWEVDIHDR